MIAVGVGAGVSGSRNNLISISGPTANSDYYQTNDYTAAGAALRALALGTCQGTISVIKQVVPSTAPPGRSPAPCRPAAGSSGPRRRRAVSPSTRPRARPRPASGARQLQPLVPGRHDDGAGDGDRDAAGRLHPGTAGRTQRDLSPAGHERRGHRHELRCHRLPGDGGDRLPGQLHRVQPRALTRGQRAWSTRSGSSTARASTRGRNRPASTPRSPSAASRRAGVWCAPASSRATDGAERDRHACADCSAR